MRLYGKCFNKSMKEIYKIVSKIPKGYVSTYGQIAMLADIPNNSRLVGRAMSFAPKNIPAHRVVNHKGRIAPGWEEQRELLVKEGVSFKTNGNVDLKRHLWVPI